VLRQAEIKPEAQFHFHPRKGWPVALESSGWGKGTGLGNRQESDYT